MLTSMYIVVVFMLGGELKTTSLQSVSTTLDLTQCITETRAIESVLDLMGAQILELSCVGDDK